MCNAWNHPSWCTCGWGGDGHLGRRSGETPGAPPLYSLRSLPRPTFTTVASFTNPNARCPVCGESVFYYQSPYGGRVFFDDLGPPWPKHPCTSFDRPTQVWLAGGQIAPGPSPVSPRPWQIHRWRPFFAEAVTALPDMPNWFQLVGVLDDRNSTLYIQSEGELDGALFQIRSRADGTFDVAFMVVAPDGQICSRQVVALTVAPVRPRVAVASEPSAKERSGPAPFEANTALAQALLKAHGQSSSQRQRH